MVAAAGLVQSVDWSRIKDAHGYAGELPKILARLSLLVGSAFEETLGELCSRIWYNGSIYPATAHAVRELNRILDTAVSPQKSYLYEVLAAVTESAREAALCPPERPCGAGSHSDGLAVLRSVSLARQRYKRDLDDRSAQVRRLAARLLVSCDDVATAGEIRQLFTQATDCRVRSELLAGLLRMADGVPDWTRFIAETLETERDPESRFLLRCAELAALRNGVSQEALGDMVRMFIEANLTNERSFTDTCGDPDQFVQAIGMLSHERQVQAICMALHGMPDENLSMLLAERLLRVVFYDDRANWGDASYRMVNRDGTESSYDWAIVIILKTLVRKLVWPWLPVLRNRWPHELADGMVPYIEYGNLEGPAPKFDHKLTREQQLAVVTISRHDPLWRVYTNLWEVFALPSNRREMDEYGVAGE